MTKTLVLKLGGELVETAADRGALARLAASITRHRPLVLVACLDNLVKGAAGQALQNFNVLCGFDERTALL